MHFQKLSAMICVATLVGASSPNVRAADTEAQAKARELLRQKMAELDGPGATTTPANPAPALPPAAVITTTPPADAPLVVVVTPTPRGTLTPEQEAQLREQMRKTMAELDAQKGNGQPPAITITPAQPAPKSAATEFQNTGTLPPAAVVVTPANVRPRHHLSPEDEARVRDAMHEEEAKLNAADQAKMTVKANPEKAAHDAAMAVADTKQDSAKISFTPTAPATLVPGSKEQRLYDLLQLYKADKITPSDYHQQRAKIVAE